MHTFTRKNILILLFFCFSFFTLKTNLYATENTTLFVPEQEDSLKTPSFIFEQENSLKTPSFISEQEDTFQLPSVVPSLKSSHTTNWFLSDIRASEAYASITTTPTEDTIVAVIDTGVDYTHSAFTNALWMNEAEQTGEPDVDDDNNGYIDDIYGYNFRNDTPDPMDNSTGSIQGHGTHIADTILRTTNVRNGENPFRVKIMCLKAGDAYGNFSASDVMEAVNYAIANGASVINLSISTSKSNPDLKEVLRKASLSAVIVAAAGNKGVSTSDSGYSSATNYYPAGYPFVAGIMAYTQEHRLAYFSNWDFAEYSSVNYECAVPGTDIYAAAPKGEYKLMSGTSMATAVASGAATLLWVKYRDVPNMTPQTLTARLMYTEAETIPFTDNYGKSYQFRKLHLPALLTESFVPKPVISSVQHEADEQTLSVSLLNRQCAAKNLTVTLSFPTDVNWASQSMHYDSFGALEEITADFVIPWKILTEEDLPVTVSLSYENGLDTKDMQTYTETYAFSIDTNGILGNPELAIPLKKIILPASPMIVAVSSCEKLSVSLIPENTTEDRTLNFTSSAPEIVSIDEMGNFTAHRNGQAVLTVTAATGLQSSVKVLVIALPSENDSTPPSEDAPNNNTSPDTKPQIPSDGTNNATNNHKPQQPSDSSNNVSNNHKPQMPSDNSNNAPNNNKDTENAEKKSKLKTPTITTIKRTGTLQSPRLQLRWKRIPSASGYVIYRKKGTNGSWKKTTTVSSKKLYWTDHTCKTNTSYYYRIKALGNQYTQNSSFAFSGKMVLPKRVQKVRVTMKNQKLQISFQKQAKVTGYEIYISTKKSGFYKKFKNTDSRTRITIKNPFPKKNCYLKVRAYYKNNNRIISGAFSQISTPNK